MTPDLQPTLSDARVELSPLRQDDFDSLFAAASDPLIWVQHPASNRWKRDVFEEFFSIAMASGGAFLIRDTETGAVIGSSRFHGFDPAASSIEIGWTFLIRSHWGGGYNRSIKRLMLGHAFGFVDQVILFAGETNWRSRRAIEKIGGQQVGTRQDADGAQSIRYAVTSNVLV